MVVLDLKLDGVYEFAHFDINFTYPKRVVHSIIEDEHLEGRERFRYKKAIILMGANATGKTTLGLALQKIFTYINTGDPAPLLEMAMKDQASFEIDFVNGGFTLHRLSGTICRAADRVDIAYRSTEIGKTDFYEKCIQNFLDRTSELEKDPQYLRQSVGEIHARFACPWTDPSPKLAEADPEIVLKTLRAVIGTLDPSLRDISTPEHTHNTFLIHRRNQDIIIQEGKILHRELLSGGTAQGIDAALFLASMMGDDISFYFCDERFAGVQSDVEKMLFTLMMERVQNNEQLIFTTHNTDMLDLNLPKHSFVFLRREPEDGDFRICAMSASDVLKRNTDSVKCAMVNDVFASLPDLSLLAELDLGWPHHE
ncbi:MAG: DNA repair protein Rad50 [Clostridia bacterium]|nr:DNA repair protein Rad50 [Clostridia bacterium]